MERQVYDRMAELDQRHWWYRARRKVLASLIERVVQPEPDSRILEIGCGTGHNFPMLGKYGKVEAIEIDPAARAMAEDRLGRSIGSAPLPTLDGVADASFDMIGSFDVIEHIPDDHGALAGIARCLKPGGKFVMTVPAHQWMWSAHDVVNHHKRRYSKKTLDAAITKAGLRHNGLSWFNSLLFPAAVAARLAGRLTGKDDSDDSPPPKLLNSLFETVFRVERHLIGRVPLTPGLSILTLARK